MDAYRWVEAYALESLSTLSAEHRRQATPAWIDAPAALACRTGMRDFAARVGCHRARPGDGVALDAARTVAAQLDSPHFVAMPTGAAARRVRPSLIAWRDGS